MLFKSTLFYWYHNSQEFNMQMFDLTADKSKQLTTLIINQLEVAGFAFFKA